MDLLYSHVTKLLEDNVEDVPMVMQNNKTEFCRMMIKSPKMQGFFEKFTAALD